MENPFLRKYYRNSPRSRMGEIPVNSRQTKSPSTKPSKVVEIPVHFVGSEKNRSTSALKIQKVFRGFLVRKSMKKIVGIKREVDEIERKILQKETVDLIRRDTKERLKVNEMLMALLFRLDSIRGVDSGVRDCRKSVIKKAIMLQERVDSIVAGDQTLEMVDDDDENKDQVLEMADCVDSSDNQESLAGVDGQNIENRDSVNFSENCETGDSVFDQNIELAEHVEPEQEQNSGEAAEKTFEFQGSVQSTRDDCDPMVESPENSQIIAEYEGNSEIKADNGGSEFAEEDNLMESVEEGDEKAAEKEEEEEETVMEIQQPELIEENQVGETMSVEYGQKRGDETKDLIVRMIEGNEKLTGLVAELSERNELQTRLISSLSERVENLEKAFKSERLRRKKKRMDTTSKATKCGRKS
ncbi:IQ motif [Macleaya cordata]|uniref:IQ motif n=1 Tax=Macleaya cordata TaxID=56857 RepID=A0A200R407_MACCD|nr:IQ motif [Macleaya cordata]